MSGAADPAPAPAGPEGEAASGRALGSGGERSLRPSSDSSSDSSPGAGPAPAALRLLRAAGRLGLAALLVGWGLTWTARGWWVGELAASLAWYLGLAGAAGTLLLLAVGLRRAALVALVPTAALLPEALLHLPDDRAGPLAAPTGELVVASSNLFWEDDAVDGFLAFLDRHDPDVVALQEVSARTLPALEGLADRYPFLVVSPEVVHAKTWATAVLSRVPVTAARLVPAPEGIDRPVIEVTLDHAGAAVVLRNVHPMRPGKPWRNARRGLVLDQLGALPWDAHGILCGDLNTASTSPAFGDLVAATGLRDSRRGFGRQPTWTTSRHLAGLEVAIDHVLVGDAWHVLERSVHDVPGSDHRSVVARLALVDGE